jgi:hypothetical protein
VAVPVLSKQGIADLVCCAQVVEKITDAMYADRLSVEAKADVETAVRAAASRITRILIQAAEETSE